MCDRLARRRPGVFGPEEVLATYARRKAIQQLQEMDGLDLDRPDVMAEAWR